MHFKKQISILLLSTLSLSVNAAITKENALTKFHSLQKKELMCYSALLSKGDSLMAGMFDCTLPAKDGYEKLILDVRQSKNTSVPDAVWRDINDRYIVAAQNCENSNKWVSPGLESISFYQCSSNLYQSLAETAIILNLK